MKQQNPWRTTEINALQDAFLRNPNVSPEELCALLPMHTRGSIDGKRAELGIERPGIPQYRPGAVARYRSGWAAIAKILESGPRSRQQIADALGCTRANVQMIMATMRGHWHVGGYQPSGHYAVMTPMIKLGAGKDAPYPKKSTQAKGRVSNPFSVSAGLIKPIEVASIQGRVIKHLYDDIEEQAA